MELIDRAKDLDYFGQMWESKADKGFTHTSQKWDGRAQDWEKELSRDTPFRRSVSERVSKVAGYLRQQGLLGTESRVIDIGCGPGRFVTEFAKTAKHVTGLDLSSEMLRLGEQHAREEGLTNVSFCDNDFMNVDLEQVGWQDHFDLVFTSITPAIGTVTSLKKAMRMSRKYCFNSSFVHWEDKLEKQIAQELYGQEYCPSQENQGRWFYALFNLLWLSGYCPETQFHQQEQSSEILLNDDLARYYARTFSGDMTVTEMEVERILRFLNAKANGASVIRQQTKRSYGWILWDVTKNRSEK